MKFLIVDDEKKMTDALTERLRLRGFDATPVYDAKSALKQLQEFEFDGMILDLRLPDIDGLDVLSITKAVQPKIRVVILSGHGNEGDFQKCIEHGAAACFHKPAKIDHLIEALTG